MQKFVDENRADPGRAISGERGAQEDTYSQGTPALFENLWYLLTLYCFSVMYY